MFSKSKIFFGTLALAWMALGASAHADLFDLYLQGQLGTAGTTNSEVMPGGGSPSIGNGLGVRVGAKVLFLEAYADRSQFFDSANANRLVLGFSGGLKLGPLHFLAHGGGGIASEHDGGIDGNSSIESRAGFIVRGGVAIEGSVMSHVALGLSVEDEYFALSDTSNGMSIMPSATSDVHTGTDALGMLYVKVDIGL